MSAELLDRARSGDREAFTELVEPHRGELQVHCYRMLGSLQDAEDALQETLLAAWLGLDGFEGRASVRTWLYRIATNRCLNQLRSAGRRPVTAAPLPVPAAGADPDERGALAAALSGRAARRASPIRRRVPRRATSPARRSRSPSSPPCNCCRRTSARAAAARRARLPRAETADLLGLTEDAVTGALKRPARRWTRPHSPAPPPPTPSGPEERS